MFSRIGHFLLIVALMVTIGGHWAVLQSVAWATMLADNARVAPFASAWERTFDGKHPCTLCKQVAQGRNSERKSDFQSELKKLDFINKAPVFIFSAPRYFVLAGRPEFSARSLSLSPPVPPPRDRSV